MTRQSKSKNKMLGPAFKFTGRVRTLRLSSEEPYVEANTSKRARPCAKVGKPGYECLTELEFLGSKQAAALGLKPGAYVHVCVKPNSTQGAYVPVNSATEARRVGVDHCGCVKKSGGGVSGRRACAKGPMRSREP